MKAGVPAFLAYFFCFVSHKVEDLLYYQLYAQLLSFVLMILLPDEQSYVMNSENELEMPSQTGHRSKNTSNNPFDSKKSPRSNEAQLVALTARGFRLKKILKALKATKEFTRTLSFMVMMTCINGFSTCLIYFGLNNLHGNIFMNGLVLSVADLSAYAFSLYTRQEGDVSEVYYFQMVFLLATGALSAATVTLPTLGAGLVIHNELLFAFVLWGIKFFLSLQQLSLADQTEDLFEKKRHFLESQALSDAASRLVCVITPLVSQLDGSSYVLLMISVASLVGAVLAAMNYKYYSY